jgi:hypothetical protein
MMSLTALAVISRQGTPLYLHDYASNNNHWKKEDDDQDFDDMLLGGSNNEYDDITGNGESMTTKITSAKQRQEWPCRIKYQFILHASCERLHEILEENMWKTPPTSGGSMGIMDACWVGYLCSSDNVRRMVSVCVCVCVCACLCKKKKSVVYYCWEYDEGGRLNCC